MNYSFFIMAWKLSTNPCIGRVPLHQGEKSTEEQQFAKNDDHCGAGVGEGTSLKAITFPLWD
jgi:hypothetical protein